MEKDEQQPVAREPWLRLLRQDEDAPPGATDARIRDAARRAIRSRPRRWWLPASLAASALLAALLVQWQLRPPSPVGVMTESDGAAADAADSRAIAPAAKSEGPALRDAKPPEVRLKSRPESRDAQRVDEATAPAAPPVAERPSPAPVGGPERELEALNDMPAPPARAPEARRGAAPAQELSAQRLSPEAWYERIEELRARGLHEEAGRELERLEEAYPGWLARRLEENRRREAPSVTDPPPGGAP